MDIIIFYLVLFFISVVIHFADDFNLLISLSFISMLSMLLYLSLKAPDVGMTEAALGVGISTLLVVNYLTSINSFTGDSKIDFIYLMYLSFFLFLAGLFWYIIDWNSIFLHDTILHDYYIYSVKNDIHINSFVAGILACYRSFDTLIETCVIFIGGIGMYNVANIEQNQNTGIEEKDNIIISGVLSILIPYMVVFAAYIQLNGTISPGGGFQSGTIIATILILIRKFIHKIEISPKLLIRLGAIGVLIYFTIGILSLFNGLNFLNYEYLLNTDYSARHLGIELVEVGVGLTVSTMLFLIYLVSENFCVAQKK